jgi:putative addiction module antidote
MNMVSKIAKHGNSAAIPVSKEILAKLRVGMGDRIYLTETPTGFHMSASDPAFEAKMEAAEKIMREDRDILRVLAK